MLEAIKQVGRLAPIALPIGLVVGLLFPFLADLFKSYLIITLFLPLTLSLLCTPTEKIISSLLNIKLLLSAIVWILVVSPLLVAGVLSVVDVHQSIALAAIFSAAAPPVTAAAAIAVFLRLNSAVAACVTVCSILLTPIVLPLSLQYIINIELELDLWVLSLQLVAFIFTSFSSALFFKWVLGTQTITNNKLLFDGVSVISISLFNIGIMSGLPTMIINQPWFVMGNLMLSSALVLALYCVTTIAFWRAGANTAMAIAIASGNCNLGLMYLVLADKVNPEVLVFFSVGQIPMYVLPTLLMPLVNRWRNEGAA